MTVTIVPAANTLDDWRSVYWGADFQLSRSAIESINRGVAAVQAIIDRNVAVYGINTGFGKLASVRIADVDLATLQRNLVLSHSVGVGELLEPNVVRLIAAIKVASLCQGASGARLSTIEMIVNVIAAGLIPAVPAQGSVGASGDLAPLAHFVCALMGEGEFLVDGKAVPAGKVLQDNGFEPLVLGAKEGLALLNGTQVSTGLALKGLFETERAFQSSLISGAMALDGFKGTRVPFDARIHALRPHAGQVDVAASLWTLMEGSEILASHKGQTRVQDPYSFRCMPQVLGSCLDSLRHAAGVLALEAKSVSDNPLIFDNGDVISGGNFHAEPTAFAADIIALATVEIGSISERRGT
ncbi:histidine ammonia-lyase, partial [Mesorhizobium sp. M7D.F.Ca.US.004.03.1.1]|uniref:aromatic amino acid lyase n=1 Tax=Mesorhizobium sp. M7D.F.Ca.US.004.03.1.1 TaxID=2496702 RepID=UPI000FCCA4C4